MLFRSFFHSAQKIFINSGVGIWNNGGIAGFLIKFHRANAANDGIAVPVFPHGGQTAQQQGSAHTVALLTVQHTGGTEKVRRGGIVTGVTHDLAAAGGDPAANGRMGKTDSAFTGSAVARVVRTQSSTR